ncbi:ribosomal protein L32 [Pycnococcus provasolii]
MNFLGIPLPPLWTAWHRRRLPSCAWAIATPHQRHSDADERLLPVRRSAKMKPIKKVKKEVKKKTKFFRNQSDTELRVKTSWRRPRGIDGRCRRKFRGCVPMPNIGYGTNKKHRHILPNGFIKFVVNNVSDLEMLIMHNRSYCAEVAHNVGAAKRKDIVQRAKELNIALTNGKARLRSQEDD